MDINGKKIAEAILQKIAQKTSQLPSPPGIVFILVGDDLASQTYVGMKEKACARVGFVSEKLHLPEDISEKELLRIIESYNINPKIDGILVQMPLPSQINPTVIFEAISPNKDVDGFHPINVGKMLMQKDALVPCTPLGIMTLLQECQIQTSGKNVLVVGRSHIVGRPIANLLSQNRPFGNATVTIAHSRTQNLQKLSQNADIIIAALGKPRAIKSEMIKDQAVVIDVGIHKIDGKICGDVDYANVCQKCAFITPVPGGVGPMTIASLMQNTLQAAIWNHQIPNLSPND